MKPNKDNLKERFLNLRNKLNLTQQEASKLFGVQLSTWQSWEWGTHAPSFANVQMLEQYEVNPPEKTNIAEICKLVRSRLGLKRGDMAKLLGVQANSWSYWERGVMKPNSESRNKIERIFRELEEKEAFCKAS